jgi:hypothetical protein
MDALVLSHTELTETGRRVLSRGEPISVFFLNAAALRRVRLHRPEKVFLRLESGEKRQLVLGRVH